MARSTVRVCSRPGCPNWQPCPEHHRESDRARGTSTQRGYSGQHESRFRRGVLARDKTCVCVDGRCRHHDGPCTAPATDADHWPLSRRQLVTTGQDPNDPQYGRGLCGRCHAARTGRDRA
jgi:5-methylcytosine-specific restriction protein A